VLINQKNHLTKRVTVHKVNVQRFAGLPVAHVGFLPNGMESWGGFERDILRVACSATPFLDVVDDAKFVT